MAGSGALNSACKLPKISMMPFGVILGGATFGVGSTGGFVGMGTKPNALRDTMAAYGLSANGATSACAAATTPSAANSPEMMCLFMVRI